MNIRSFVQSLALVGIGALGMGLVFYVHYEHKIDLYQQRLRETLHTIHNLEHELAGEAVDDHGHGEHD